MNEITISKNGEILSTDAMLDCDLALTAGELHLLLCEEAGNAAKEFAVHGEMISGRRPPVRGQVFHPRPTAVSNTEMLYNLDMYGYEMITVRRVYPTPVIRPEYVVVCAVYDFDMRHLTSGMPVVLAKAPIVWGLMRYEAVRHGFGELLLGALQGMRDHGVMPAAAGPTLRWLYDRGIEPSEWSDLPKTIRTYELSPTPSAACGPGHDGTF